MTADWLRIARTARMLSWLTLGWLGVEAGVAIGAAVLAGSVALLGFGLDSGVEALASIIVIWRFTGTRLVSATSERRAQRLVAVSFYLLACGCRQCRHLKRPANTRGSDRPADRVVGRVCCRRRVRRGICRRVVSGRGPGAAGACCSDRRIR